MRLTRKNMINEFQGVCNHAHINAANKLLQQAKADLKDGIYGDLEQKMDEACELLGLYGVTPVRKEGHWDGYFGDTIALYFQQCDTYDTTVICDLINKKIIIRSVGDFIEDGYR